MLTRNIYSMHFLFLINYLSFFIFHNKFAMNALKKPIEIKQKPI
mgnify:CR=1 FL=1